MSGVGSSGKSGTPPIGHGPNAVVRSTKHNDERKSGKDAKKQTPSQENKEGHDELAVRMDVSLYHLNIGDVIDGWVSKTNNEKSLILDSEIGKFSLNGSFKLAVGEQITIKIINISPNIEADVIAAAGINLNEPIRAMVTPLTLHSNKKQGEENQPARPMPVEKSSYSAVEQTTSQFSGISEEDAALILSHQSIEAHASSNIHPPKVKDGLHLSNQSLSSLIEANAEPTHENPKVVLKQHQDQGHDNRPSLSFFHDSYEAKHPENLRELDLLFNGRNGLVPSGLAFFVAGLVFNNIETWLGAGIYSQMAEHPALTSLEADYNNLHEHIHCLANENWRLMILPHPQGGINRAMHIISNIQSGQAQDGTHLDMRTVITQLSFKQANKGEKPLGQLQIEATLMPNNCGISFRFSRDLSELERSDIEQMASMFFTKAGVKGHVLFTPFSSGHTDFQDIVNELSITNPAKNIST